MPQVGVRPDDLSIRSQFPNEYNFCNANAAIKPTQSREKLTARIRPPAPQITPVLRSKRPLIAGCNAVQIPLQPGHRENRPRAIAVRRPRLRWPWPTAQHSSALTARSDSRVTVSAVPALLRRLAGLPNHLPALPGGPAGPPLPHVPQGTFPIGAWNITPAIPMFQKEHFVAGPAPWHWNRPFPKLIHRIGPKTFEITRFQLRNWLPAPSRPKCKFLYTCMTSQPGRGARNPIG